MPYDIEVTMRDYSGKFYTEFRATNKTHVLNDIAITMRRLKNAMPDFDDVTIKIKKRAGAKRGTKLEMKKDAG